MCKSRNAAEQHMTICLLMIHYFTLEFTRIGVPIVGLTTFNNHLLQQYFCAFLCSFRYRINNVDADGTETAAVLFYTKIRVMFDTYRCLNAKLKFTTMQTN